MGGPTGVFSGPMRYALYRDTDEIEEVPILCTRPLKTFDDAFQAAVAHDLALLRWFKRDPSIFVTGKSGRSRRGLCFNFAYTSRMQMWVRQDFLWAHPEQTQAAAAEYSKGLTQRLPTMTDLMSRMEAQFNSDYQGRTLGRTMPVCQVGPPRRMLATAIAKACQGKDGLAQH